MSVPEPSTKCRKYSTCWGMRRTRLTALVDNMLRFVIGHLQRRVELSPREEEQQTTVLNRARQFDGRLALGFGYAGRRTGRPLAAERQNRIVRSRRKSPFPTVATSKTPGMEICKARPSGDSHGLADFHLRRLIPCRRKEITGIYQTFLF